MEQTTLVGLFRLNLKKGSEAITLLSTHPSQMEALQAVPKPGNYILLPVEQFRNQTTADQASNFNENS